MKKLLALLVPVFVFLFEACVDTNEELKRTVNVTVICDLTDPQNLLPIAEPILKLLEFNRYKNTEASLKICPITDKNLNPAEEFHLADCSVTEKDNDNGDPYHREKIIVTFYDEVKRAFASFVTGLTPDSSLQHSECFSTIAGELQLMNSTKGVRNYLLLFTDLQENSSLYNCYSFANQKLLIQHPDTVVELFNATHLLPNDLNNTKVIFVYQPRTREDDNRFNAMLKIYRKLLEPRGAIVKVQANNNRFN